MESKKYKVSENVVSREIEDEIIIVPLISGIGSMDDDLYSLNSTGKKIWKYLDGKHSIRDISLKLADEYDAPRDIIADQIRELMAVLLEKGIVAEY